MRTSKGLCIWNEETENAIRNKYVECRQYLQKNNEESKEEYKQKQNLAKTLVDGASVIMDRFINQIENNVCGKQNFAFKTLKHLNRSEKDAVNGTEKEMLPEIEDNSKIDFISISELQVALKGLKTGKQQGYR